MPTLVRRRLINSDPSDTPAGAAERRTEVVAVMSVLGHQKLG